MPAHGEQDGGIATQMHTGQRVSAVGLTSTDAGVGVCLMCVGSRKEA